MNLHRVALNSLFYKLLNKGIYITAPLQTFPFSPLFPFIFLELKLGHSPFDPHELTNKREERRGKYGKGCLYCCCDSVTKIERERGREGGRIKGKEDVVKTQAPKRLT